MLSHDGSGASTADQNGNQLAASGCCVEPERKRLKTCVRHVAGQSANRQVVGGQPIRPVSVPTGINLDALNLEEKAMLEEELAEIDKTVLFNSQSLSVSSASTFCETAKFEPLPVDNYYHNDVTMESVSSTVDVSQLERLGIPAYREDCYWDDSPSFLRDLASKLTTMRKNGNFSSGIEKDVEIVFDHILGRPNKNLDIVHDIKCVNKCWIVFADALLRYICFLCDQAICGNFIQETFFQLYASSMKFVRRALKQVESIRTILEKNQLGMRMLLKTLTRELPLLVDLQTVGDDFRQDYDEVLNMLAEARPS